MPATHWRDHKQTKEYIGADGYKKVKGTKLSALVDIWRAWDDLFINY